MSCSDCHVSFGFFSSRHTCAVCKQKELCRKCADKLVLPEGKHGLESCLSCVCLECFKATSCLDFSRTYDEYGDDSSPVVILVHGSAGSRNMWNSELVQKMAATHKVFSVDLPGHGSRMQEELTLDSALSALESFHEEHVGLERGAAYIGNSLGAYTIMGLIGRSPELVDKALLAGCAQNTCSVDSSWKAALGLTVMNAMSGMLSNATLFKSLLSQVPDTVPLELMEETFLRSGVFFSTTAAGSVAILREVNPAESLARAKHPSNLWFVTGALDHHDSLTRWTQQTGGRAIVYDDVDHFFSHDTRTMPIWHADVLEFLKLQ